MQMTERNYEKSLLVFDNVHSSIEASWLLIIIHFEKDRERGPGTRNSFFFKTRNGSEEHVLFLVRTEERGTRS